MKKILVSLSLSAAAFLGFATTASAHVPTVTADCRVLSVDLTDYEKGTTVAVNVDGETATYTFTGDFHKAIPLKADAAHTWTVSVDNKGNGQHDEWDASWKGTTVPCVPATTKPPVINVDLTPPTTTAAPVDYCATLAAYHTANPAAPNVDGWDYQCAPTLVNPPTVIDTQVQDRTVTPVADTPVVLAFTGTDETGKIITGLALFGVGLLTLAAGRRFGRA